VLNVTLLQRMSIEPGEATVLESTGLVVGLIGCGDYGRVHAGSCAAEPGLRLKWVWSRTRPKCEEFAAEFGTHVPDDWRGILDDPEVDVVIIATPDFAHAQYAVAALEAGKHVFLEKPMATSVSECLEIIEARDQAEKKIMVNYHNRWYPPAIAAREAVRSGRIGQPVSATFVLSDTISWVTGNMKWGERSGPEWFLMSHIADLACWVLGDHPSSVYASARKGLLASRGIDTNDLVKAQMRMAGGAIVDLESSWILAERWRNPVNDMWFNVQGETGRVDVTMDYEGITVTDGRGAQTPFVYLDLTEAPPLRDFATAIVDDRPSPVPAEEALVATQIVAAVVESFSCGDPVELQPRERS
jgi:predicted dehydrogenase